MKDASGELSMTVITILAVVAVGGIFALFVWPIIQQQLANSTCRTYGKNYEAAKVASPDTPGGSSIFKLSQNKYECCPEGKSAGSEGCYKTE